jgi:hypothetical protein
MGEPRRAGTGTAAPVPSPAATGGRRPGASLRPGRGWYVLAAVVGAGSVVVTGALGIVTAMDLVQRVDDFARFDAPGTTTVDVSEPGDYSVYHEHRASPAGSDVDPDVTLTVTGPDGSEVSVRSSAADYGWGSRQADGVGTFTAARPGSYEVRAAGDGRLAVGRSIPTGWLYGFGGTALAGAAGAVASGVLAVVVGVRRRRARRRGAPPGLADPTGPGATGSTDPAGPDGPPGPDLPGGDPSRRFPWWRPVPGSGRRERRRLVSGRRGRGAPPAGRGRVPGPRPGVGRPGVGPRPWTR